MDYFRTLEYLGIETEVIDLARMFCNLQSEEYLQGNQIFMFDKDGKFDEENSFKILQLPLKNTSDFSINHPIFNS